MNARFRELVARSRVNDPRAILNKHRGKAPSISISLHQTHFCLNDSQERLTYDSPKGEILLAIRNRRVPESMLEELYANGTPFYDGCLIVEVHDHRRKTIVGFKIKESVHVDLIPGANRAATPAEEANNMREVENMHAQGPDGTPFLLSSLPKTTTVVVFPPDRNSASQSAAGMLDTSEVAIFQPSSDVERTRSSAVARNDPMHDKDGGNPNGKSGNLHALSDASTPSQVTDAFSSPMNQLGSFTELGSDRAIATGKLQHNTLNPSDYTAPTATARPLSSTPHSSATSRQGSFARTLPQSAFDRKLLQDYLSTKAHDEFDRQGKEPFTRFLDASWSLSNFFPDNTDQDLQTYRELSSSELQHERVSERTTSQQLSVADSDNESDRGSVVSQVDSIFSVASLSSTASTFSTASGYNAVQIETATRELLHIFLEDAILVALYKTAIQRVDVGSERLQRNIRRMLKAFAQSLQVAANKDLERLAARLVSMKASYVSQCIIERYEARSPGVSASNPRLWRQTDDDSSDEEDVDGDMQNDLIDEDLFEDLSAFRGFLTGGHAFVIFRNQLEAFALPRSPEVQSRAPPKEFMGDQVKSTNAQGQLSKQMEEENSKMVPHRKLLNKVQGRLTDLLVAVGFLEPPLSPGWVRLRWQCKCGGSFYGDVMEYREGGINQVIERMHQSTGAKVTVTCYTDSSSNQNWSFKTPEWARKVVDSFSSGWAKSPSLPQHSAPIRNSVPTTSIATNSTTSTGETLHLLACVHQTQERKSLLQKSVDEVKNDRSLFLFMRQQLKQNRSRLRTLLSLRSVQGIYFLKIHLRIGNLVEVREHNLSCGSSQLASCYCFPPESKTEPSPTAEYRCKPVVAAWPPVDPKHLLHMLQSPGCINEQGTSILNILPRRICGQLEEGIAEPAEGWGIYYKEGLDCDMIVGVVLVIFVLASLLFAVLWSVLKMDIQGAFGVSSYVVTASGIIVAWVASRAKNFQ